MSREFLDEVAYLELIAVISELPDANKDRLHNFIRMYFVVYPGADRENKQVHSSFVDLCKQVYYDCAITSEDMHPLTYLSGGWKIIINPPKQNE